MELLDYFVRFFLALLLPSHSLHDNETKLLSLVFILLSSLESVCVSGGIITEVDSP